MGISQQRAKHLDHFWDQSFDYSVTVCDRIRESCPTFPDDGEPIHWSLSDPAASEGISERERDDAFAKVAQQLLTRLRHLLQLIAYEQSQQTRSAC
jgi:protein-tyrosine-phosphatase